MPSRRLPRSEPTELQGYIRRSFHYSAWIAVVGLRFRPNLGELVVVDMICNIFHVAEQMTADVPYDVSNGLRPRVPYPHADNPSMCLG